MRMDPFTDLRFVVVDSRGFELALHLAHALIEPLMPPKWYGLFFQLRQLSLELELNLFSRMQSFNAALSSLNAAAARIRSVHVDLVEFLFVFNIGFDCHFSLLV